MKNSMQQQDELYQKLNAYREKQPARGRGRQREEAELALAAWARKQTRNRLVTMTTTEFSKALAQAVTQEVPPPPDVLGETIRIQHERGLR